MNGVAPHCHVAGRTGGRSGCYVQKWIIVAVGRAGVILIGRVVEWLGGPRGARRVPALDLAGNRRIESSKRLKGAWRGACSYSPIPV